MNATLNENSLPNKTSLTASLVFLFPLTNFPSFKRGRVSTLTILTAKLRTLYLYPRSFPLLFFLLVTQGYYTIIIHFTHYRYDRLAYACHSYHTPTRYCCCSRLDHSSCITRLWMPAILPQTTSSHSIIAEPTYSHLYRFPESDTFFGTPNF